MARPIRRVPIFVLSLSATALAFVVAMALAGPALAHGQHPTGVPPPGNSGVSQYTEDIPTASGGKPSSGVVIPPAGGGGSGPSSGSSIPVSVTRTLNHSGHSGRAAAALAAGTAGAEVAGRLEIGAVGSPAGDVLKALGGGGGGLGALLPILLIGSLVLVSIVGLRRRHGGGTIGGDSGDGDG